MSYRFLNHIVLEYERYCWEGKCLNMYNYVDLDTINLNGEPPIDDTARQFYFMAGCKKIIEKKKEEIGRDLTACVKTFGCQMNARDSEKLIGILEEIGYLIIEDEKADFVIYNTCTVRENANLKVYGHLGILQNYKKKNPDMKIALCGCMMQENHVVEKIKKSYRFVGEEQC